MSASEKLLHIDTPVNLAEVKGSVQCRCSGVEGDLPACLFHLKLLENDIADWNARSHVVAVFPSRP